MLRFWVVFLGGRSGVCFFFVWGLFVGLVLFCLFVWVISLFSFLKSNFGKLYRVCPTNTQNSLITLPYDIHRTLHIGKHLQNKEKQMKNCR